MTRISVRGLCLAYDGKEILKDLDLEIDRPGLTCIIGPNGVGKTTLVKCMNGLLKPTSGIVEIDGVDISEYSLAERARIMAYVPNANSATFGMTVMEAVLMGRQPLAGWTTSDEDLLAVENAIRTMDMEEFADRDIRELSAGQYQRAMIARGIAQDPSVLILDEPTSNLDVKYQMNVMRFLKRYAREKNIIVLMISHDLNMTADYADRVILLGGGKTHSDGTPAQVLSSETIKTVYGVDTQVSVSEHGTPHIRFVPDVDADLPPLQEFTEVGVRPQRPSERRQMAKVLGSVFVIGILMCAAFVGLGHGSEGDHGILGKEISYSELPDDSRLWVFGNANGDDLLDSDDVTCLNEYLVNGGVKYSVLMDANADGKVNSDDIDYLKRIISAIGTREKIDVYYVDYYSQVAKVSWPVKTIATTYCSGAYLVELAGLADKVVAVDTTIHDYWRALNPDVFGKVGQLGTTENPNWELIMFKGTDVYVPGYCDAGADPDSKNAFKGSGTEVMFINTCDNEKLDHPNEHIDRSILMFAFLLQGNMDRVYKYLEWHDGVMSDIREFASGLKDSDKQSMVMARSSPFYDTDGLYSYTGYNNTNNIHALWAGVDAIGMRSGTLSKNYQNLSAEDIIKILEYDSRSETVYYMDNAHDGLRGQYNLDDCIDADKEMLKNVSRTVHYLGMAREIGNSPMYIVEMVFYMNVMYGYEVHDFKDLFNYYFDNFTRCGSSGSGVDVDNFLKDFGEA